MPDAWDYSQPRPKPIAKLTQLPVITTLLCAGCIVVTLASMTSATFPSPVWQTVGRFGSVTPDEIWNGHWWGLLTPFFPHANVLHVGFNMLWLFGMGRLMEARLNPFIYVLLLAASAAVGTASEMLVSHSTGIGASGVVYAMMGMMWAGRGRYPEWQTIATRDNLRVFLGWAVFCIVTTYLHLQNIANGAHVGGFLFGLSVGWLFLAPRRRPLWTIPLVLLLAISTLALTWMPWSSEWTFWKGGRELDRAHYQNAVYWYGINLSRSNDPHAAARNLGLAWQGIEQQSIQRKDVTQARAAHERAAQWFQAAGPDTDDSP